MRVLLGLLLVISTGFSKANAAEACITGIKANMSFSHKDNFHEYLIDGQTIYMAAYSCQDVDVVSDGLKVTALVVQAGALIAACSVGGAPVSVALQGATIGLGAIDLFVSNLDCVNETQEAQIKQQVDEAVCSALSNQGIECYPPLQLQDSVLL